MIKGYDKRGLQLAVASVDWRLCLYSVVLLLLLEHHYHLYYCEFYATIVKKQTIIYMKEGQTT